MKALKITKITIASILDFYDAHSQSKKCKKNVWGLVKKINIKGRNFGVQSDTIEGDSKAWQKVSVTVSHKLQM